MKENEKLQEDVTPEVRVTELQLQQVLVGEVLRKELPRPLLSRGSLWVALVLASDGVQLEAEEGVQHVVAVLQWKRSFASDAPVKFSANMR